VGEEVPVSDRFREWDEMVRRERELGDAYAAHLRSLGGPVHSRDPEVDETLTEMACWRPDGDETMMNRWLMMAGMITGVGLMLYLVAFMVAMMWITLKFVGAE
jgi:hypothetical protein